jgi:single-strand DNA-binding protein
MAARGVNKVILVGNLGADPEVRTSPNGSSIANLRVATGEAWRDQQGQLQERTEWHAVSAWGKTAELCGQYLAKGRKVYVEGRLESREYIDKEGVKRKVWEVRADKVTFLDGTKRDEERPSASDAVWMGQGAPKVADRVRSNPPFSKLTTPDDSDPIPF